MGVTSQHSRHGWTIARIARRFQSYLDARTTEYGVSAAHVPLLNYLWEGNSGNTQNDIAKMLGVDKGTVSRTVAALSRRGLVVQQTSRIDSRACIVSLTAEGEALREPISAITDEWCSAIAESLGHDAFSVLVEALENADDTARELLEGRPNVGPLVAATDVA